MAFGASGEPPRFRHFAAIDWSGAVGERQRGIAVALCSGGSEAPDLVHSGRIWSRTEVLDWLANELPQDTLVGMDLGPALPFHDEGAYFPGWHRSPDDARGLWALVDEICALDQHLAATSFVDHPEASRHFRRHGGRIGDRFAPGRGRLRATEIAQRDAGFNPYSNMNLVGAAQVGKSSLTGMRLFHHLAGRLPLWPFDPVPEKGSVIVEIYTSIAAVAGGRSKSRSKIRDAAALDAALAALGSRPHRPLDQYTDHATDAIVTAAWLRMVHADPALWNPIGLDAVRHTEGWTFGVP